MDNEKIVAPIIKGVNGGTGEAKIEKSTDFYPIVEIPELSDNPDSIIDNSILINFKETDIFEERYKPFVLEMKYPQSDPENPKYVPYLRMWPSSTEERIFSLRCKVSKGRNNCSCDGDIYYRIVKPIEGLTILAPDGKVAKDCYIDDSFTLELSLTKDADRAPTEINAVPLIFYVIHDKIEHEVGRVHLSVAPKDVFSKAEVQVYLDEFEKVQNKINDSQNYCLPAFREALEALLGIKANGSNEMNKSYRTKINKYTNNYDNYVMHTYCQALEDLNIANHYFTTAYNLNSKGTLFKYKNNQSIMTDYNPTQMPTTMAVSVSNKFDTEDSKQLGYHIYGVSVVNGSHVMSIVMDNSTLDNPKFTLSDYHVGGSKTYDSSVIDLALDAHTIGAWKYHFVRVGNGIKKPNSKLDLWKIQNY